MKPRYSLFAVLTVVGLLLDQAVKLYIDRTMQLFDSIPVVTDFFHITYVRNRGAAFSFLSHASWRLPFFIGITLVAAVAIVGALALYLDFINLFLSLLRLFGTRRE